MSSIAYSEAKPWHPGAVTKPLLVALTGVKSIREAGAGRA